VARRSSIANWWRYTQTNVVNRLGGAHRCRSFGAFLQHAVMIWVCAGFEAVVARAGIDKSRSGRKSLFLVQVAGPPDRGQETPVRPIIQRDLANRIFGWVINQVAAWPARCCAGSQEHPAWRLQRLSRAGVQENMNSAPMCTSARWRENGRCLLYRFHDRDGLLDRIQRLSHGPDAENRSRKNGRSAAAGSG